MRSVILLLLIAVPASAQFAPGYSPNPTPLNYLPNYFNRSSQPLSPYLNLMRGFNPATNYYYGTRPGTPAGGVNVFGQAPTYQPFVGSNVGGFLPQSTMPAEAGMVYEPGGKPIILRSSGHPVVFGNTFANHGSFLSVTMNAQNRGQLPFGGLQKSTAQGVGNSAPRK